MQYVPRSVTLVLLESGSQWPRWVGGCPYRAPDAVVFGAQRHPLSRRVECADRTTATKGCSAPCGCPEQSP